MTAGQRDNCELLRQVPEPAESRATSGLITAAAIMPARFAKVSLQFDF
jgi:hypothetical protein